MRALGLLLAIALLHPEEWLAKASVDLSRIQTLDATVVRVTTRERVSQKECWRIRLRAPDEFRIDLMEPEVRVVVATDSLMEYLPQAQQAVHTRFHTPTARRTLLQKILGHVAIAGSRFGNPEDLLRRYHFEAHPWGKGAHLVGTPKNNRDGTLLLDLLPQGLARGELYDPCNRLVLRQSARNFRQFGEITLPQDTLTEVYQPQRCTVEIRIKEIRVNEDIPDAAFLLKIPSETKVQEQIR